MATYTRPEWVKPGEQWSSGQTYEQYASSGAAVNPNYTPETKTGLESIEQSLQEVSAQIPGVQSGLTELSTEGSPAIGNGANDIAASANGAATAGQAQIDQYQKMMDILIKQSEDAAKQAAEAQKGWKSLIAKHEETAAGQKTQQELREEAQAQVYAEMGMTAEQFQQIGPLIGQINTYNQQLADLNAITQQGLLNIEQRMLGRPGEIMRGEQALYQKQQNIDISSIAMQAGVATQHLQLLQGAYADARTTTNQIVEAATYQQRQELADIEWSLSAYKDMYDMASQEEQIAWNRSYTMAKDELDKVTKDKTQVNQWMIDTKGEAGILITDTVEEATEKLNKWQQEQAALPGEAPTYAPTQYSKEWTEAGGQAGTGMTLSDWIKQRTGITGEEGIDTRRYIQDPKNPAISIPNPNYGQPIVQEIPPPPDYVNSFQAYQNKGWSRDAVESSWISQYNTTVSAANQLRDKKDMEKQFPEVKSALDEVYGKTPSLWERTKTWWGSLWD